MKTYEVIIHYAGTVNIQVEADNEEQAHEEAQQAFDDVSDAELIANLADIHICDCYEV